MRLLAQSSTISRAGRGCQPRTRLIREAIVPSALAAALYRLAATLPGRHARPARDQRGRPGGHRHHVDPAPRL